MIWERYLLLTERVQHTLLFNPNNEAVFLMTNDIRQHLSRTHKAKEIAKCRNLQSNERVALTVRP